MRTALLMIALLAPPLAAQEGTSPGEPVQHGLPGALPGTERWIVTFRSRSFDLTAFRQANLSPQATAEDVARIVADLEQEVRLDQAAFARLVRELGGRMHRQWWLINGCAIDIPFARLEQIRRHPRVLYLEPDREWEVSGPIKVSTNASNHRVDNLQQKGIKAQGVTVAIMDTGLDSDMGGTGRPHRTFYVNGDINNKTGGGLGGSRILANIQMGTYPADDPHGHGTGCAGIAAGEVWGTSGSDRGHAPLASIVGYAIASGSSGSSTTAVMTATWQRIAADAKQYGTVAANNSFSGSPSATNSTQQALDSCALNADVVCVVAAGNNGTRSGTAQTQSSQSALNGLAVGAFTANSKTRASFSSRGPLYGDTQRFYPDLAACGYQTVMPKRNSESSNYVGSGTSMASPQVCGAATLFRSVNTTATALETKAAILATTEDISKQNPGADRNTYGMGFLRDDNLVDLAQGGGTLLTGSISGSGPVTHPVTVTAGKAYSVVIAWNRHTVSSTNWSNLGLSVKYGTTTLGSSDTPRNVYERVIFLAPASGKATIEVTSSYLEKTPLPYALAVYEIPPPFMPGGMLSYGKGCLGTGQVEGVATVLPGSYAKTWGESNTIVPLGWHHHRMQQVYGTKAVPGAFFTNGIAFRHDDTLVKSVNNYWVELAVDLGYSDKDPATMSATFNANISGTMQNVLAKKKVNLPYWTSANPEPTNWLIRIPFDRSFSYQAQSGKHLLLDFRKTGSSTGNTYTYYTIDAVKDPKNPEVSILLAQDPNATLGIITPGFGALVGLTQPGTGGAVPILDHLGVPEIGTTFSLDLRQARPNSVAGVVVGLSDRTWQGIPLPFDLGGLGAPGCNLLAGLDLMVFTSTDSKGIGKLPLALPLDKSLIQANLHLQAMILDPPANQAGLAWSNGLTAIPGGQP